MHLCIKVILIIAARLSADANIAHTATKINLLTKAVFISPFSNVRHNQIFIVQTAISASIKFPFN